MQAQKTATVIRRIALTGFMGSGKSTVGPRLARRLGWSFVDVDEAVEAEEGASIASIFAAQGEPAFRAMECAMIAKLAAGDGVVISLGGGAIESEPSRQLLLGTPGLLLVHLEVKLETTLARCAGTEGTRPVLADKANLAARYERRLPLYRQAHLSVLCDDLTPDEVVESIVREAGIE